MKGKIVDLKWIAGCNINSSRGYKKNDIKKAMKTADYVVNNGYGNYSVLEYSKYMAKFHFEDGTVTSLDIKSQIKNALNISRMTKNERVKIEAMLPINAEVVDCDITFLI